MKKTISSYALLVAVFALGVFALGSCKKNTTNANQQFIGTYAGAYSLNGVPTGSDTFTVVAGLNSNAIIGTAKGGGEVLSGTVSGNNISFPDQGITVTVANTAVPGTAAGTGTLTAGTTMVVSLNDTITGLGSGTYSFTGVKY